MFLHVETRAGILILTAAAIVGWAILYPDSLASTIDGAVGVIEGAWEGATGSV